MDEWGRPDDDERAARRRHILENDATAKRELYDPWPLVAAEQWGSGCAIGDGDLAEAVDRLGYLLELRVQFRTAELESQETSLLRPASRKRAAELCTMLHPFVEQGDGVAVLEAIAACATHGLVPPAWLAEAFVQRYERVVYGECRSWSDAEAFGSAYAKNENLTGRRTYIRDGPRAYTAAVGLLQSDPSIAIGKGLWEQVGKRIHKGATQTEQLINKYSENRVRPPLSFVRRGFRAGWTEQQVHEGWRKVRATREKK